MERNVQTDGVLAQALSSRMKITNTWFSSFTVLPYFPKIIKQDLQLWRNKVVWQLHSSVLVKATVFFQGKTEEKRQLLMAAGREGKNVKGEWLRDREKEMTENRQEAIAEVLVYSKTCFGETETVFHFSSNNPKATWPLCRNKNLEEPMTVPVF